MMRDAKPAMATPAAAVRVTDDHSHPRAPAASFIPMVDGRCPIVDRRSPVNASQESPDSILIPSTYTLV
jgi:hypothetical protein